MVSCNLPLPLEKHSANQESYRLLLQATEQSLSFHLVFYSFNSPDGPMIQPSRSGIILPPTQAEIAIASNLDLAEILWYTDSLATE